MMLGEPCRYETPCGWCWKWDKKCDKKIGCEKPDDVITISPELTEKIKETRKMKDKVWLNYIFNEYGGIR